MKVNLFSACFVATFFFSAHSFAQSTTYTINGKLENVSPMPVKMYLSEFVRAGMLQKTIDSANVVNGQYQFSGELTVDEAIGITISSIKNLDGNPDPNNRLLVMVDKGELNLVSVGTIENFTASGSAATAQHQFEDMNSGIRQAKDSIRKLITSEDFKTNKELQAEVQKRSGAMSTKMIFGMYSYVKNNPGNRVSPFGTLLLITLPFLSQAGKDTLLQVLPAGVKADKLGTAITTAYAVDKATMDSLIKDAAAKAEANMSKVAIGSKAQDFKQNNPGGKAVRLSSFKGKYVLVDFWASWCHPCRAENPNVVKAYNKYKDKGFTVLGVSLDGQSGREAWLKAIESDGLVWTQVSDLKGGGNEAARLYDVKLIPQNFLIDPNGVIIAKNLKGEELSKKLAELFN